jgi:hypothetical protein
MTIADLNVCSPARRPARRPAGVGGTVEDYWGGGELFPARFSSQLTAQVARQGGARAVACLGEGGGGRFLVGASGVPPPGS